MRPTQLIKIVASACLIGLVLSVSMPGCDPGKTETKDSTYRIFGRAGTVDINAALDTSASNKTILNIYPVKESDDMDKEDFALRFIFQDADGSGKNLSGDFNEQKLIQQAGWYFDYLKIQGQPFKSIPYGYYVKVDSNLVKKDTGINVWVLPFKSQLQYFLSSQSTYDTYPNDSSAGRCPPLCPTELQLVILDSAGRCPPCIDIEKLLLSDKMKQLIEERYKNEKN